MRLPSEVGDRRRMRTAKGQFVELRGVAAAAKRARDIGGRHSKLWNGRRVWQVRCNGTTGRGPHDMFVPAAALWNLISVSEFRCPYHA